MNLRVYTKGMWVDIKDAKAWQLEDGALIVYADNQDGELGVLCVFAAGEWTSVERA